MIGSSSQNIRFGEGERNIQNSCIAKREFPYILKWRAYTFILFCFIYHILCIFIILQLPSCSKSSNTSHRMLREQTQLPRDIFYIPYPEIHGILINISLYLHMRRIMVVHRRCRTILILISSNISHKEYYISNYFLTISEIHYF